MELTTVNKEHLYPVQKGVKPPQEQKEAITAYILERFVDGEEIQKILKDQPYISVLTFYYWMVDDPILDKMYMKARAIKAHQLFDDLLTTARGNQHEKDTLTAVARDRLITDKMTFYLAKAVPKMYGDKLDVTTNGESINIISLGGGTKPPEDSQYIDITPEAATPPKLSYKDKRRGMKLEE
jgi:hypothetical protein